MSKEAMRSAVEALEYMQREKADYMIRNKLGDPSRETATTLANAALSLLRAELEAGGEAAPVAWRYRYRARDDYPAGPWHLSDRELEMTPGQEIVPLYASPVAADTQGDAKDAARYRWLRYFNNFARVDAMLDTTDYTTLDAAVDAAMGSAVTQQERTGG